MALTRVTGQWYDTAAVQAHSTKLGTVPAGGWLHEVDVQGNIILAYSNPTFSTANHPTYNLSAGVQYGAIGYAPGTITNGTGGTNSWLTFSEGLPPSFLVNDVLGTSPVNVMERTSYGNRQRWRGLVYFPNGIDIWFECGLNQADAVATAFYNFYTWSFQYTT